MMNKCSGSVTSNIANNGQTLKSFAPFASIIHKLVILLGAAILLGSNIPIGRHRQIIRTMNDISKKIVCFLCIMLVILRVLNHL